MYFVTVM